MRRDGHGLSMSKVVWGVIVLALSACAPSIADTCRGWGFTLGTPEFSDCAIKLSQQRAQSRTDALRALGEYRALTQPNYPPTVIMPAAPAPTPVQPIIIQPRNPTFGEAVQPSVDLLK